MPSRRETLLAAAGLAAGGLAAGGLAAEGLAAEGLAAGSLASGPALANRGPVPLGSAAQIETFREDGRYREALKKYCNVIVPMNDLKWEALRHQRKSFDFSGADELVGFAERNGQAVRGHALLWGEALPAWAKTMSSKAEAERELIGHIETVVDRYKGRIATWDVVNEVIAYDPMPGEPMRDTIWQRLLGPQHVEIAFRTAARIDPKARLVLNDFHFEEPGEGVAARRKIALDLFRRLRDKGIPVHGLGMQAHLYAERPIDTHGLQQFMFELDKLDIDVEITELDVIDWKLPPEPGTRDRAAASLVSSFLNAIVSVRQPRAIVTWGLTDRYSWVHDTFPRKDSALGRPLPLDADYKPKPMMTVLNRYRRSAI